MSRLTSAEAAAFKARWALVNAAEIAELRSTSLEVKLQQLASLMASVEQMGWGPALAAEEEKVRERWHRLRETYRRREKPR